MRDTIKNRAYFEEYLEVNEKRIERFQNQLQDLLSKIFQADRGAPHLSQASVGAGSALCIPPVRT